MNVRRLRKWLVLSAACIAVASAALLLWGLFAPVELAEAKSETGSAINVKLTSGTKVNSVESGSVEPDLARLRQLCSKKLRRPLYDKPAAPTVKVKNTRKAPALKFRLTGIAQEPGHSVAVFKMSNGAMELVSQGDALDDGASEEVVVTAIGKRKVTLRCGSREFELELPEQIAAGAAGAAGGAGVAGGVR